MIIDLQTLAEHVADSLWLSTFADAVERAHEDGHDVRDIRPGAGGDWADCPYRPVPSAVLKQAVDALARIPADTLQAGAAAWLEASGCDEERLGHCLAMRMLGHGVGLFDDVRPDDAPKGGAIDRLGRAAPYLECFAWWNPETGKVEL